MATTLESTEITLLNYKTPEELLRWAWEQCGSRAAIFTSFQDSGCVLIDMAQRVAPELQAATEPELIHDSSTIELIRRYRAARG